MGLFDQLKLNKSDNVLDMEFPFYVAPNTATIPCCHIIEVKTPFCMYPMMKMMECGKFSYTNA